MTERFSIEKIKTELGLMEKLDSLVASCDAVPSMSNAYYYGELKGSLRGWETAWRKAKKYLRHTRTCEEHRLDEDSGCGKCCCGLETVLKKLNA